MRDEINTIGQNIKRIRKEKGLTQKELGKLCGINEAQIRRYELGGHNSNPKIETIEKIANALQVDKWELIGFSPVTLETAFSGGATMDFRIAQYLSNLSKKENQELEFYIDISENNKHSPDERIKCYSQYYNLLNHTGQQEAVKRIEELTHIEKYTKPEDPEE